MAAAPVCADAGTGSDAGGGDVLISWMGITDSDAVPVAKYTLTLNQGGWDDPIYKACAVLASIAYEIYLCITASALWLIDFVMSFHWLALFTGPFQTIGHGVDHAMDQFGLAPTALAVLAIVAAATVLAGRTAKAVSNLAMGVLMTGLAATIFAHPLAQLVGPHGMLADGRDTGLQIAAQVSGHGAGGAVQVEDMVALLADRFLRKPTQMINFGEVSDSVSRKCRHAWSTGITQGHGDTLKDDIAGCDDTKGRAMHQKSMGNPAAVLVPLAMCGLLSIILVAFACYFVWHVMRAAVQAMLYAALAPPAFAIGVIPGGAQTFAWKTVLDAAMAFAAMIIYTAAFGGYNAILDQVFRESNAIKAIFVTALVLAFGFAFFGPLRRILDRSRDTMAARLSGRTAPTAGRTWWTKAADISRPTHDLGGPRGRSQSPRSGRTPTTITPESATPAIAATSPPTGQQGAAAGDVATPRVTPARSDADAQQRPTPAEISTPGRNRERLTEAIRLARTARSGVPAPDLGRHALSEVA